MKTILNLLIVLVLLGTQRLIAQDALVMAFPDESNKQPVSNATGKHLFEFMASSKSFDINAISKENVSEHFLGDLVSRKLYLMETKYTYQVEMIPGNPQMKTVIRKPVIFEAVLKIERYLKKSVKKGDITVEKAATDFNKVLDVALNVLTADTNIFEKAISSADDASALLNLLTNQVNLVF
ncbi:MAG: hypothetical protein GZ094_22020 [Mariniphaga sp.]|nr:hypothetical protein [Mariniphaga sp.]